MKRTKREKKKTKKQKKKASNPNKVMPAIYLRQATQEMAEISEMTRIFSHFRPL
jgi:hypothetical protein